jgi:uncharacterized RDD family membrane protein YckC
VSRPIRPTQAKTLQGHRAGLVSRVVADAIDLGVIWALGLSALLLAGAVRYLLPGLPFRTPVLPNWLTAAAGMAIAIGYLAAGWAATGRTVGKQAAGLRVLDRSGRRLLARRALLRAVLCVAFPAGLLWVLVSRHNASVQDLLAGTIVVYDWSYHPADETPRSGGVRSLAPPRSDLGPDPPGPNHRPRNPGIQ